MSSRATLIILLALIAGCQDIGTLRRPAHEGKRARLDDSLDSLLAVPMHIRCDRAIVAVSPDQRKQIQIFG